MMISFCYKPLLLFLLVTWNTILCFLWRFITGNQSLRWNLPNKQEGRIARVGNDLEILETVSVGGYATVHLVQNLDDHRAYALKVIKKTDIISEVQRKQVLAEEKILMMCDNDFIVRLHKAFCDGERLYLLMEWCQGGDLWSIVQQRGHLDEDSTRYYSASMLEALDYLHQRSIVHRDLKPENVLIDHTGLPKLVDFGCAKQLGIDEHAKTWTFCGTIEYLAPEVVLNQGHDFGVDLWALGVFIYELQTGAPMFVGPNAVAIYEKILEGVHQFNWSNNLSADAIQLIKQLCSQRPCDRIGYTKREEIRRVRWFSTIDFDLLTQRMIRPPIIPSEKHDFYSRYAHRSLDNASATEPQKSVPSTSNRDFSEFRHWEIGWDSMHT